MRSKLSATSDIHDGNGDRSPWRERCQHRRAREVSRSSAQRIVDQEHRHLDGSVNTNTLGMLLKLVAEKKLPVESFVTQQFSFDEIPEAYEVFGNASKYDALKVLIH